MTPTIRATPDGRISIIDAIAAHLGVSYTRAQAHYYRVINIDATLVCERVPLPSRIDVKHRRGRKGGFQNCPQQTPVATDAQWSAIQATMPNRARIAARQTRSAKDDLYIMQYSTDTCAVKIGRAYNVENRRRQLEMGQNFFVRVLASFSGDGHLETDVHEHIAVFRNTS